MLENILALVLQIDFPGASVVMPIVWIVAGWWLLKYVLTCIALWNVKVRDHKETPIQAGELHPEVRRHLQPWLQRLGELGFGEPNLVQIEPQSGLERVL